MWAQYYVRLIIMTIYYSILFTINHSLAIGYVYLTVFSINYKHLIEFNINNSMGFITETPQFSKQMSWSSLFNE